MWLTNGQFQEANIVLDGNFKQVLNSRQVADIFQHYPKWCSNQANMFHPTMHPMMLDQHVAFSERPLTILRFNNAPMPLCILN